MIQRLETTQSVEDGIPTRRGREFLAALLSPASNRLGVASGIQDSNTANRTNQFSSDPLISANRSSYFNSFTQIYPQVASLACRCAQFPRHNSGYGQLQTPMR